MAPGGTGPPKPFLSEALRLNQTECLSATHDASVLPEQPAVVPYLRTLHKLPAAL